MLILTDPLPPAGTPESRLSGLLAEQRIAPTEPTPAEAPSTGELLAASFRTSNVLGSLWSNRLNRIAAGYSPITGDPLSIEERRDGFDPLAILGDPTFYEAQPWAVQGFDQLAGTRSRGEFDVVLGNLQQTFADHETIARAGTGSALAAGLAVNLVDPTNLIPLGYVAKTAQGARIAALVANVARGAAIAGTANVVQEELLHAIQPGRPVDRIEADLAAFGMGAVLGGAVSFIAAPNFRPSARQLQRYVPTARVADIQARVRKVFDTPDPATGQPVRNLVTALEEDEVQLRALLDEKPRPDAAVAILRTNKARAAGDTIETTNESLLRQVQDKYAKAGEELTILKHPLQDDYDAFTPLEIAANETQQQLRRLARQDTGSAAAEAADLTDDALDAAVMQGSTLIGKAMSYLTPASAFDRSVLDLVQLGRRVLFFDGTVSKGAATRETYSGPVPAEALKDLYSVNLHNAIQQVRQAYAPDRNYGAILGRGEGDTLQLSTGRKVSTFLEREPITWTSAAGETQTIPAHGHMSDFFRAAVQVIREQKAASDGFIDAGWQQVPERLQSAVDAIRGYYDQMLDLADQAGVLPGERTLRKADDAAEQAQAEVDQLLDQRQQLRQQGQLPGMEDDGAEAVYTTIPKEYHVGTLFDWGRKGLRMPHQVGRHKSMPIAYLDQLDRIQVGTEPTTIRHLREITGEVYEVKERVGKWWRTAYYLAPQKAIEAARTRSVRAKMTSIEAKLQTAEARLAQVQQRADELRLFNMRADGYFTRRYLREAVQRDKPGFTGWLIRSWEKARSLGDDPETGALVRLEPWERPIIPEIRDRLGIPERYRTEGDLAQAEINGQSAIWATGYEAAVQRWFTEQAEKTYEKIVDPQNGHGVEAAYAGGSPLKHRRLTIDESDPAARTFMDGDAERILSAYHHTVGGIIATRTAIQRARHLFGRAGAEIETPDDFLKVLRSRFDDLNTALSAVDRQAGTKLADGIQRDRRRVLVRMERRIAQLEGRSGLLDGSAGANAAFEWAGRQALTLNYLALLGSQVLAAVNDVASLALFADVTSLPRNVKMLTKAMLPLKEAGKRDLRLLRIGFESEHARVRALGDVDFDDPRAGVGFGASRTITNAVAAGMDNMATVFNEATLVNSWNRFLKRGAASIATDRLVTLAKRMHRYDALVRGGMAKARATRKAGIGSRGWDVAMLRQRGIDAASRERLLQLIHRHGELENGIPVREAMDFETFLGSDAIVLPNAGAWLDELGDEARPLFDAFTTAINSEVERAMIVTPSSLDRPLMNDQWWGRALNQFQTFAMAWGNQVARPLAQRPAGRQVATLAAYFTIGALVDAIRNHIAGRRDIGETARLWGENPLGMTYSVVHTSGLSGWFNRPLAFADKLGVGPGAWLGNTTISRSAYQARSFLSSLSPTADLIERGVYGLSGITQPDGFSVQHAHALRKAIPFQNLIWFRLATQFAGVDPYLTEKILSERRGEMEPRP